MQPRHRYRFRFISAQTLLLYIILLAIVIVIVPPTPLSTLLATGIILHGILRLSNQFVPYRYACGITLSDDRFTVQRAPFGWRWAVYDYRGFLRLFVLPGAQRMILAFAKDSHTVRALSTLEQRLTEDQNGDVLWLSIPIIKNPAFPATLLQFVEQSGQHDGTNTYTDLDIPQAYAAYQQTRRQPLFIQLWQRTRHAFTIMLWGIGYNQFAPPTPHRAFRYPDEQTQTARHLIAATGFVGIISLLLTFASPSNATLTGSVAILALMLMIGPLFWLILYYFSRQSGISISATTCHLQFPLRYFDRHIPLAELAAVQVVNIDCVGMIWLRPRPVAPGDDARPPRPIALQSQSIADVAACVELLQSHIENRLADAWQAHHLQRQLRRRGFIRRSLLFFVFPIVTLILLIAMYQFAFALSVF